MLWLFRSWIAAPVATSSMYLAEWLRRQVATTPISALQSLTRAVSTASAYCRRSQLSVKFHRLPCRREPRGLLVVEFDKYYMLCTHLSLNEEDRVTSVGIIRDVVSKLDKPAFIAGDMNARPTSKPMEAFKEYAQVLSNDKKFTIPSNDPRACIDYILGVNGTFKVLKDFVGYDILYSDHLPLYVDVKVGKAKKR